MKVIMIGSDRKLFAEGSAVRSRILEYGSLSEELHVIVFSQKNLGLKDVKIADNVWLYPTNSKNRFRYMSDAVRLGNKIKGADIVTTQDPFEAGYVGWKMSRRGGPKLHVQIHTDFFSPFFVKGSFLNKIRVRIARFIIPRAECVRVVSKKIADSIQFHNIKIKNNPYILPIFVDIKKIWKQVPQIDLHLKYPQFENIIVMTSRLTVEKNVVSALEAMSEVIKKHPKTGLVIVGEGPEKAHLIEYIERYTLQDNVIIESWTDDVVSYYKTAEMFLNTSYYEGYGMSIIEAVASDCPVITTDVGIARDFFGQSHGVIICPVNNTACIVKSIMRLVEGDVLRRQLRLKAQRVVQCLVISDKKKYLNKYLESWKRCI